VPAPETDTKSSRWVKPGVTAGGHLYAAYCAGCHGPAGQGAEGPALNNKVLLSIATDTYLFETISRGRRGSSMDGFAKPSTVHPALTPAEIESLVAFIRSWEKPQ
jgi:mono/diheme cytochrome c family protein